MLFEIFPYVVGAAVSPVVLATCVLLLAQPQKPIQKTFAYALGGTLAATVIGTAIFLTVHAKSQAAMPTFSASVIHVMVGLVLLGLAVKVWRKTPKKARRVSKKVHYGRDFGLGILLMASNFTSLIMFVPASLDLQHAPADTRLTALILLITASTLAMWLPLFFVVVSGKHGRKLLKSMSKFMAAHGQQVSGGLIGFIAIYVLYKGISGL
jgi:threonine/homoserine/homoserine lactone efflux protein